MGVDQMSLRFCLKGRIESFFQLAIGASLSKDLSQVDFFVRKQTGPDLTIGGQPKTIAVRTEVSADCADQSDLSDRPFESESQRRPVFLISLDGDQLPSFRRFLIWDG
jgi:hypothetical protein